MSLELLTAYGWLGWLLALWVGLSVGSFLNVVIYRYPVMLEREWRAQAREILEEPAEDAADETFNLAVPGSRCPACGHKIRAWENIPVISWLVLRGRCSACGTRISFRYPGIELLTGIMTLAVLATFGFTSTGYAACLLTWLLVAATFIDYDTKLLPDQLTYPVLWLGLFCNAFLIPIVPIGDAIAGALAGYLFLWGTYWAFKLITGKEGMGYGDFKLLAGLGAWMGWQALPHILLIAAVLGLIYAGSRIFSKKQTRQDSIPFGPFLAGAGWVVLLFPITGLA